MFSLILRSDVVCFCRVNVLGFKLSSTAKSLQVDLPSFLLVKVAQKPPLKMVSTERLRVFIADLFLYDFLSIVYAFQPPAEPPPEPDDLWSFFFDPLLPLQSPSQAYMFLK